MTGSVNYKGATYNLKKIDLKESINLTDLPEIQIVNFNYSNPYLLRYYDYVLEQDEIDGVWVNKAVYILMENSDYDLKTYILKYGPLSLENMFKLCESLIGANYYLQKEIKMPHGDVRLQNIRIILNQTSNDSQKDQLTFKLSYFDDILRANVAHNRNRTENLAYMAPELLSSSIISSSYFNQNISYFPSEELQTLIAECPDEIRYDPFRADAFSAGLTAFSAATGVIFTLDHPNQSFEVYRDGRMETILFGKNLNNLKTKHQCKGLTELLRIMLTQNPLLRCDFEELAIRMNKMKERNPGLPRIELIREESSMKQEYELLKENYWELQEMVGEMKDKENDYKNTIETLKVQLQRFSQTNQAPLQNISINNLPQITPYNILNDISAIPLDDDNGSFLSSAPGSPRKALGLTASNEKEMKTLILRRI